jgi:hypothetical protein
MKNERRFWAVTHRHTTYVEAETEAAAREDCADQVRDNAEADDCEAEEISEHAYEQHWARIENGPHGGPNTAPRINEEATR